MLYKLSDFAHLCDVGVGINLAYTILEQVHSYSSKVYSEKVSSLLAECMTIAEPNGNSGLVNNYLTNKHENKLRELQSLSGKIVKFSRGAALVLSIILTVLLGRIGFSPDEMISQLESWAIVLCLISPIPLILIVLFVYWRFWMWRLEKDLNDDKKQLNNSQATIMESLKKSF